ncbi:FecCD family ABC transporter permease [Arcobacter porcinus]|uniref:FecCD family ABC transporter permease n=1 Tax=Arcobacter porcinus TaxID=1935204 RepID=UPI00082604FA|nr:iron ABC transporter permease [Arcobacter porcinus]OCL85093.1 Hemin transport system permease protein HmuU [Arcobacter porcinus]OCL86656.1 Hemin transport system permease protein HmuU [Arcobacter porcinus]
MKILLYIFSILIIISAPFLGETIIEFKSIFDFESTFSTIFWDLRVPRVFLAFFVGSILALSGLIFQIIFKNQLITPYTLGIASGTTLFSSLSIVFLPLLPLFFASIFGSLLTVLILFIISKNLNSKKLVNSTNSILLIGIALSYFYGSALMLVFFLSNLQENYSIVRFTLGTLDTVGTVPAFVVGLTAIFLILFIYKMRNSINLLLISNDTAFLKGLNVNKTILTLLIFITICVGICISFTGPIGFVGLVIPHIVKLIYKKSAINIIFPTLFFGGVFLVFCDLISRLIPTASSLPIGVVTAFIGAPFFVYLLIKKQK